MNDGSLPWRFGVYLEHEPLPKFGVIKEVLPMPNDPDANYQGPGRYRHYKGGEYEVLGLALREELAHKEGPFSTALKECEHCGSRGTEVECRCRYRRHVNLAVVIYRPLTPGSMLEGRDEDFWSRPLDDFNATVNNPGHMPALVPRFERMT
jgi:hypothetical protein